MSGIDIAFDKTVSKSTKKVLQKSCSSIDVKKTLFAIMPLLFAQIVQRFYPIIDNHYMALMGAQALLIHNIQYSFISLGQYIGGATAVSCLVFWNRANYVDKQGGVFYMHMGLCLAISMICILIASYYSNNIMSHFSVPTEYYPLAMSYFRLGLCNMTLQAIYLGLIGIVIAVNKEKLSLIFSAVMLTLNVVIDSLAVSIFYFGGNSPQQISPAMLAIILSNMAVILFCIGIVLRLLRRKIKYLCFSECKEIFKVWINELGGAFISGVYPIIYIFQLGLIKTSGSMLVTYQLLMQLTAVFCIPILATMQIALRDASAEHGVIRSQQHVSRWVRELIYFGLIPTEILICIFAIFPVFFIQFVFGYVTPDDQVSYVVVYLLASVIGQVGNALTVAIRARKKSHLVTLGYFICDVIVLVGGTQLLIFAHFANPMTAGIVMLIYTTIYTFINANFALRNKFK